MKEKELENKLEGKSEPETELFDYRSCRPAYGKPNCIEFPVSYDEKPRTIAVRSFSDGSVRLSTLVQVRDRLIVGAGDSYASGEGNPDIPAQFKNGKTDIDFLYALKIKKAPEMDKNTEVGWLDWRCHRSMYSYQFRTALQLALANPQQAVTYVSYSCSGGTTDNIIGEEQPFNEFRRRDLSALKKNQPYPKIVPQIQSLKKVLNNRPIDYLLLSTGGNDIGFAGYVVYILTSGSILRVAGKKPGVNSIDDTYGITGNYKKLHNALLNKDSPKKINIRDCRAGKPCDRIILTP